MRKPKSYPKMLYRDAATLIVPNARALEKARGEGWRTRDEVMAAQA